MSAMLPTLLGTPGKIPRVAVIGGGPAGLMAAEILQNGGVQVALYDGMASVGRKFLLAGIGGMNITHSEPAPAFLNRYADRAPQMAPLLDAFGSADLLDWIHALGIATFVGSSGRIFPKEMKAAPLLRAWLQRLRKSGVQFHMRHRWLGWQGGPQGKSSAPDAAQTICFATPQGPHTVTVDAVILALGGASWARLGSDGAWLPLLTERGVQVAPLRPANCGFIRPWSPHFVERCAGQALKSIVASCVDRDGAVHQRAGEMLVTEYGLEGSLIYAFSRHLRGQIDTSGHAIIHLDLAPGKDLQRVTEEVAYPRGSRSLGSHLQSRVGITGVKAGLLRECLDAATFADPVKLAAGIKALPVRLDACRPLDEAISTAGGVSFAALDQGLMLNQVPGVFCAGEMLDWEAPTGGYLLTGCFTSGRAAGLGALRWLTRDADVAM